MEEMRTVTLTERDSPQTEVGAEALTKKDPLPSCASPLYSAALGEHPERQTQ